MTGYRRQLGFFIAFAVLTAQWGCTNRQVMGTANLQMGPINSLTTAALKNVAEVQFQNNPTEVLTIQNRGDGSLYMTGRPFGFSGWDISTNPENPTLNFAASDQIDTFAPNGKWVVDWYASGALGFWGQYAFMSGTAGMSIIDTSNTGHPTEVMRFPAVDPNSDQVSADAAYQYTAIVANPSLPFIYGFRQQDYVYTISLSGGLPQLVQKDAYGGQGVNVCCVHSATVFHGTVYVAFGSRLVWFQLGNDGSLQNPGEFDGLQAVNVASTGRYLYVQHEPNYGQPQGQQYPRGFYVFDTTGNNVNFIATDDSPTQFAVNNSDSHMYANNTNTSITIYRIIWNNQPTPPGSYGNH
jgi:hypothetical protein